MKSGRFDEVKIKKVSKERRKEGRKKRSELRGRSFGLKIES